jgi:hypothetical protein
MNELTKQQEPQASAVLNNVMTQAVSKPSKPGSYSKAMQLEVSTEDYQPSVL